MWNNSLSNNGTKKNECVLIAKYISYVKSILQTLQSEFAHKFIVPFMSYKRC